MTALTGLRANLRLMVKRILRKYKYLPVKQEEGATSAGIGGEVECRMGVIQC